MTFENASYGVLRDGVVRGRASDLFLPDLILQPASHRTSGQALEFLGPSKLSRKPCSERAVVGVVWTKSQHHHQQKHVLRTPF